MIEKTKGKTYKVADLYSEAAQLVRQEMSHLKKGALSPEEEVKTRELGKLISNMVLKEMKLA